jgi:hypothetical protein
MKGRYENGCPTKLDFCAILERDPLSLVRTTEELLEGKVAALV